MLLAWLVLVAHPLAAVAALNITSHFSPGRYIRKHAVRASLTIPANWALLGCFTDYSSQRALPGYGETSTTNTPSQCISVCSSKGYSKAGVEYGTQCYCGNTIMAATNPSVGQPVNLVDCSMPCSGDKAQNCGGGKRLQIYKYTAPLPKGWAYRGCYTDSTTLRVLGSYTVTSSSNTPETCSATCSKKGYMYAGVEWGKECFCSNTFAVSASSGIAVDASQCSMPCSGEKYEKCGNGGRIQVYALETATSSTSIRASTLTSKSSSSPTSKMSTTSSSSSVSTSKSTSTASLSTSTSSGSSTTTIAKASTSSSSTSSSTSFATSTVPITSLMSTSSSTSASYTYAATSSTASNPMTTPWTRLGCFTDSTSRTLAALSTTFADSNSPDFCTTFCRSQGYNVSGVESGTYCGCDNTISCTATLVADSDCSNPCPGNSTTTCGGTWRIELFASPSYISSQRSPWVISTTYQGNFDGWDFSNKSDPTHGMVNYLDSDRANLTGLASINSLGNIVMAVETTPVVTAGRNSIRLESQATFNRGLFIIDAVHIPTGCGTWPAFWTLGGGPWPNNGEIDIIEGVNTATLNQMSVHTSPGCTMPANCNATGYIAPWSSRNCDAKATDGSGCGVVGRDANAYGVPYNSNGGGVHAMVWDSDGIRVYFFPRGGIPVDIQLGQPLPSSWGIPSAQFPASTCDPSRFFKDHVLVFDITLCGDWAGNVWNYNSSGEVESCASQTGYSTCSAYVLNNGAAFTNAYWEVKSVSVYQ